MCSKPIKTRLVKLVEFAGAALFPPFSMPALAQSGRAQIHPGEKHDWFNQSCKGRPHFWEPALTSLRWR